MPTTKVQVYIYELTGGIARTISRSLLGIEVEGVWHTGIVAYNKEYYFSSHGISSVAPGGAIGPPTEIVEVGESEIPFKVFKEFLNELAKDRFHGSKYHLLEHNCNSFSNEVAQFLTGNTIPAKIINLPSTITNTPFGQSLRRHIDSVMSRGNRFGLFELHSLLSAYLPTRPLNARPASTGTSSSQPAGSSSRPKPPSRSTNDSASKSSHHDIDLD